MQLPVAGGNGISFASNVGLDETDPLKANAIGFKIPNLRNVTLTAPYMHDGRFKTLEEVIEHYNSGVKDNPNLDPRLRGSNGLPKKMGLTPFDKSSLIAFLNTLTDESVATDTRFSNPFK
jgi:cytochrome c peroxidase